MVYRLILLGGIENEFNGDGKVKWLIADERLKRPFYGALSWFREIKAQ